MATGRAAGDDAGALDAYRKCLALGEVDKRADVARRVDAIVAKAKERGAFAPLP